MSKTLKLLKITIVTLSLQWLITIPLGWLRTHLYQPQQSQKRFWNMDYIIRITIKFVTRQIACHSHTRETKAQRSRRASPWHATSYTHTRAQPPRYSFPSVTPPPVFPARIVGQEKKYQQQLQREQVVAEQQRASLFHAADSSSRRQPRKR